MLEVNKELDIANYWKDKNCYEIPISEYNSNKALMDYIYDNMLKKGYSLSISESESGDIVKVSKQSTTRVSGKTSTKSLNIIKDFSSETLDQIHSTLYEEGYQVYNVENITVIEDQGIDYVKLTCENLKGDGKDKFFEKLNAGNTVYGFLARYNVNFDDVPDEMVEAIDTVGYGNPVFIKKDKSGNISVYDYYNNKKIYTCKVGDKSILKMFGVIL